MFDLQLAAKKNQLLSRFDRSLQTPESKMERLELCRTYEVQYIIKTETRRNEI